MKISVIIPLYNDQATIDQCLYSVQEQTYPDLECLVVDDCGTDRTEQIAQTMAEKDHRIRLLRHTKNRGLSAARNTALEVATGDYVFFLDADDRLSNDNTLARMADQTAEQPDWVQGAYHRSNGTTTAYGQQGERMDKEAIVRHFQQLNFTNATAKLIRRKFITDHNLTFTEGLIYEDVEWAMRAYAHIQKITTIISPVYEHNIREGSITRSVFTDRKVESLQRLIDTIITLPQQDHNTQRMASYYALFLVKSLLLSNLPKDYKREQYKQLQNTGVLNLRPDRAALPPFTRLLSRVRRHYGLSSLLCNLYRLR